MNFFSLKNIEHRYTIVADLVNLTYIWIISVFVYFGISALLHRDASVFFLVPLVVSIPALVYSKIRISLVDDYLRDRYAYMQDLAGEKGYKTFQKLSRYVSATKDKDIDAMTLAHISIDSDFINFLVTPDWTYFDFSYATFRSTRYGDYKAADVYYGVMKAKLARPLPNVFFDSKKARKRQFRFIFKRRQIYHFEGDLDKYFTGYLPQNYEIDSLSFITPDVMQALKNAADYDVEIVANELFLYGPIFDLNAQLKDMANKLTAIQKTLKYTTAAYHDDHIPADAGWHKVSAQGSRLARSRFWAIVNLLTIAIFIIIRFVYALVKHS